MPTRSWKGARPGKRSYCACARATASAPRPCWAGCARNWCATARALRTCGRRLEQRFDLGVKSRHVRLAEIALDDIALLVDQESGRRHADAAEGLGGVAVAVVGDREGQRILDCVGGNV